ncbi:serine hydrolase domain-containing protein [Allosphingosinicella deserti]|uniref:serine hydrolase domain-containing protein n=1 Tax=Allosphingosinicella deserti TaxID=2116704 RepID=UPI0011B23093|nr:serine hydrolase [Sphingomonas deserti]
MKNLNSIAATRALARLATMAAAGVLVLGGAVPAQAAAHSRAGAIDTAALDRLAEQAHARGLFNGTLLVARNGRIVYQRATGVADGARTRALTTRDRFGIGSIGKEFSAVALMMLERQGALRLDDPVSRFVPGLPAWGDQVLVRHLLDYTSGLPGLRPNAAGDSLLADLRALPALQFAPGTGYLYSNNNIVLRRSVLEAAARTSFADYAQRMLLRPCGMRDAVIDPPPGAADVAAAFDNDFVGDAAGEAMPGFWIRVTANDLYRWSECLKSGRLLPVETLARHANADPKKDGALGRISLANGAIQRHRHQGSSYNFEAWLEADWADGTTVVVLTNNKNFRVGELAQAAFDIAGGKPYVVPKRSIFLALRDRIAKQGFDAGMAWLRTLPQAEAETYDLAAQEGDLNRTAYYLLQNGKRDDAVRLFRHIADAYPASANAWDSLGEALEAAGEGEEALTSYRKALALDPALTSSRDAVARLSGR